ncbi:cysteine--tRNA ligase [Candidatus Bathyarchaeota archaeon]|nr:MAG: cysteine--tRNA ligase [Candidatus Bathyarchaeota archaeon]
MPLRVYNTLTRRKEDFTPIHGNRVYMFVCGPTTYDLSHLGHARTYIAYDIIARYLRYKGYTLFYVMNITDVDDKIINRARELGVEPLELARRYERAFYEDMASLGVDTINLFARASEHIPEIIDQIRVLLEKGYAYETETGVYYDITKFRDYGALSRQDPSELREHRIEPDPTKKNPGDFALWKKRGPGEMGWDSPWGWGRPGWHIEDTAITTHYFGPQYDIHGGAIELIFPHHEAEIAQAEAATGRRPLVRYWVHTGILKIHGRKMSKSLGNFITIREALEKYQAEVLRFFFASTHYRSTIDFNERGLEQARRNLQTLYNVMEKVRRLTPKEEMDEDEARLEEEVERCRRSFIEAMDDDFNSPKALTSLLELSREVNRFADTHKAINERLLQKILGAFRELGGIFGILQREEKEVDSETLKGLMDLIIEVRQIFRERREWQISDMIRERLRDLGILLEDTEEGTFWKRIK